jgi:hypothetical protein
MNVFKRGRAHRLGGLLVGLGALVIMLVVTSTAALAVQAPPAAGGGVFSPPRPALAPVAAGGMPGWQITLIAVGAALVAAVLAVLADRARSARGRLGAIPPQASGV